MGAGGSREPTPGPGEFAAARAAMVARQLRDRDIHDPAVLAAMGAVPREAFVPGSDRAAAYADGALPIGWDQTISQPYIVARMIQLLRIQPGMRVLEIGTGSGYEAAVLAAIGATVVSVERHEPLAREARERLRSLSGALPGAGSIEVRVGDGSLGVPEGAPWDGIVVAAAAPSIPMALREQLAIGARLVIPVGSRRRQDLRVVERKGPNDWYESSDGACVFVPLIGAGGHPG